MRYKTSAALEMAVKEAAKKSPLDYLLEHYAIGILLFDRCGGAAPRKAPYLVPDWLYALFKKIDEAATVN